MSTVETLSIPSPFATITALACRECARRSPVAPQHFCESCYGPLEVVYDYEAIAATASRESIAASPPTLWRYAALLPSPTSGRVDIGAGWTRLRSAPRLAAELGLKKLWLKIDSSNPTGSFKDRVVSVALTAARLFHFDTVACASTGNLANSVAACAAAVGLESVVFIPRGVEPAKVAATSVYQGRVIAVDGSYDDANRLCAELAPRHPWGFVNVNLRPFYAEGSKTVAFEIAEQLGWRAPDAIVCPVASGSLLTKIGRGFDELERTGLMKAPRPRLFGGQAEGCAPVAAAFASGSLDVSPVKPSTVATSLAIGDPADGYYALKEVGRSGGRIVAVPKSSVAQGIRLLARTEGVFTEVAGGVTISTLEALARDGLISPDQETVAVLTGVGLKTLDVLGDAAPEPISPRVEAVEQLLAEQP